MNLACGLKYLYSISTSGIGKTRIVSNAFTSFICNGTVAWSQCSSLHCIECFQQNPILMHDQKQHPEQ